MVEIFVELLMISPYTSRGVSGSVSAIFSFGSCKEGWYFRCIGLDP
ncbi:hypothetical protein DCAR_0935117 [Daucus carota subsp. sativus]|uniref:Uncharacterized protein n=1 Tax=Daucus carota subsp. sativus TaxID=79200 RepID=A0AAF1BDN5_DAUCS|nr:hypothetical protein DCAR_0935117 [Daucus carota subsp. sativus]